MSKKKNEIQLDPPVVEKLAQLKQAHGPLDERNTALFREIFPALMMAYQKRVLSRILKKVEEAHAKDVLQKVWIRLFLQVRDHGLRDGFELTLGKVAKGRILNHLRDNKVDAETGGPPSSESLADSMPDVDRAVDYREAARRFLPRLPPTQRQVIEMVVMQGKSQAAVAAALGIPEGTVATRVEAGKARLRALMSPWIPSSQRVA